MCEGNPWTSLRFATTVLMAQQSGAMACRIRLSLMIACFVGFLAAEALAVAPPSEIRSALSSHSRAIHVKDGWIRDPYIVKGSDGWFYLTGTTQMPSQEATAEAKFNVGLGDSSLVGWTAQVWRTKDFVAWESLGEPFTLKDGVWFKARPKGFEEVPQSAVAVVGSGVARSGWTVGSRAYESVAGERCESVAHFRARGERAVVESDGGEDRPAA